MISTIYLINNLVQVIESIFFLEQVAKPKFRYSITCFIWILGMGIIYVIGTFASLTPNIQGNLRIALATSVIVGLYKDKIIKRILLLIILYSVSTITETISIYICTNLYGVSYNELVQNMDYYLSVAMLLISDLIFICLLIIAIFWRHKELLVQWNFVQLGIMLLFITIHIFMIIIYYMDKSVLDNTNNQIMQILLQLLLYFSLVFNYFNALRTRKLMESQQALKNLETEMEHNYSYYTLADEKFTEISKLRHDILNQIQTVQYILRTEKNEHEARQIMKRIEEQLAETKTVQFCPNPIINSVLTLKMNTVKASEIETDIVLNDCESLPFDNYDICSLFANLFDNAIEACQKLEDGEKRIITIRSGIKNDFFVLKITNNCKNLPDLKSGKRPKSDKGSKEHGFGTKIIDSITKKYSGTFTIRFDDNIATTVVALKIASTETTNINPSV